MSTEEPGPRRIESSNANATVWAQKPNPLAAIVACRTIEPNSLIYVLPGFEAALITEPQNYTVVAYFVWMDPVDWPPRDQDRVPRRLL